MRRLILILLLVLCSVPASAQLSPNVMFKNFPTVVTLSGINPVFPLIGVDWSPGFAHILSISPDGTTAQILVVNNGDVTQGTLTEIYTTFTLSDTYSVIDTTPNFSVQVSMTTVEGVTVVADGETIATTANPATVAVETTPPNPGANVILFNTATGDELPILLDGTGKGSVGVPLIGGLQTIVITASDPACPTCDPHVRFFNIDLGATGGFVLEPTFVRAPFNAFNNPSINWYRDDFGGWCGACSGCPPFWAFDQARAGKGGDGGTPPDPSVPTPYDGSGPNVDSHNCSAYWHLGILNLPGRGVPIDFALHYNSNLNQGTTGYVLGDAPWSHSYMQRVFDGAAGTIRRFDGRAARVDVYTDRGDGFLVSPGHPALMRINGDGTIELRLRGGLIYHYKATDDVVAPGALFKVSDPHDNAIELFYEVTGNGFGRLHRIVDTFGADALELIYRPDGLLDKIRDLTGRECVFAYDGEDRLSAVRSPVGPEFPSGRRYNFTYVAGLDLLEKVIYPNEVAAGSTEARVAFGYDPDGFVSSQKHGGTNSSGVAAGGTITYLRGTRGDGTEFTRITDRKGNVTEQEFDPAGRLAKSIVFTSGKRTNGPFVTTYSYNADGYCTTAVFPEGNSVVKTYRPSPNAYQIMDVIEVRRFAGPRGGDQTEIAVTRDYEGLFNKVSLIEDPRKVDPGFTPPLGSKAHLLTTIVYEYQELTALPAREVGWDIDPADLVLGEPDRNSNGSSLVGCATVQSITLPTTTLPDGTTQLRRVLQTYNSFGQLTSSTDPGGVKRTLAYHPEADPDGSGAFTVPGRDPSTGGFLKSRTADAAAGSIYAFHEPITRSLTYTRIGDVRRVVDGRGIVTELDPNEIHLVTEIRVATDTVGQASARNEAAPVPALTIVTKFSRDANDNIVRTEVDNRDNDLSHAGAFLTRTATYDILDNVIRTTREVTESEEIVATTVYDPNENAITFDDFQVPHTHIARTFDSRDILVTLTRGTGAEASTSTTEVDKNGNITRITGPVDRVPEAGGVADGALDTLAVHEYDGFDRLKNTADGLGNVRAVSYDPASNVIASTFTGHPANDATAAAILLQARTYTHDEASRLVKSRVALFVDSATSGSLLRPAVLDTDNPADATNVELVVIHDVNSLRTRLKVANRTLGGFEESAFEFDGHARVRKRTDAVGNVVELLYNNNHQVVETTETDIQPEGESLDETFTSSLLRDAIGRVITATDPKGDSRTFTWGTLFMREALDMLANKTTFRRDGLGRKLATKRFLTTTGRGGAPLDLSNPGNPDGIITTSSAYLDSANETRLVDDRANVTRYLHDTRKNVKEVRYADGTNASTAFDLGDAAVTVVDNAGNVFDNTFDILGRLVKTSVTRAAGFVGTTEILRKFDGLSRLTSCRDNGGEGELAIVSELDCRFDSLSNKLEEVHSGQVVSRQWKSYGDQIRLTYPDGHAVDYATDKLDRLTELTEGSAGTALWRYIGGRTHRRAWGNGTTTEYSWDLDRRLAGLKHLRNGAAFLDYSMGHNEEDYLLFQRRNHDGGQGELIELDSAYRVLAYKDGVQDPETGSGVGTRLEELFVLDGVGNWNSQTTSEDQGTPDTIATALNEMNEYTSFGADSQAHNDNGDRTADGRFTYQWDAFGRLRTISDKAGGALVSAFAYHGDGRRTYKREFEAGEPGKRTLFAWDGVRMVQESKSNGTLGARTVWGRGCEHVSYSKTAKNALFFHRDGKGWISVVTKKNGKSKEAYSYSAYGRPTFNETGERTTSNPWLYHGYFLEGGEQYYTLHRYYDSSTGRWLSRDPSAHLSRYEAFSDSPLDSFDPLGLWSIRSFARAVGRALYAAGKGIVTAPAEALATLANLQIDSQRLSPTEVVRKRARRFVRDLQDTADTIADTIRNPTEDAVASLMVGGVLIVLTGGTATYGSYRAIKALRDLKALRRKQARNHLRRRRRARERVRDEQQRRDEKKKREEPEPEIELTESPDIGTRRDRHGAQNEPGQRLEEMIERKRQGDRGRASKVNSIGKSKQRDKVELEDEAWDYLNRGECGD